VDQAIYPRKNWSSSFLINCGHPANLACTLDLLNNAPPGGFLHRFSWIEDDDLIGELPMKWNFLVGWHDKLPPTRCVLAIDWNAGPSIRSGVVSVPVCLRRKIIRVAVDKTELFEAR
jgi:hypothetical protein